MLPNHKYALMLYFTKYKVIRCILRDKNFISNRIFHTEIRRETRKKNNLKELLASEKH